MGVGVSLFLLALGAILAWAVENPDDGKVNVNTVGYILMGVALAGFLLSLMYWNTWAGPGYWTARRRRTTYVEGDPYHGQRGYYAPSGRRTTTYVEDVPPEPPVAPPPPGPPPGPPPPP